MEFLTAFDEDMEIISKPRHGAQGRISFRPRGGLRQSSCGLARLSSCGYFPPMTKLEKIDSEIESLPPQEMRALSAWFADLRERFWEQDIEWVLRRSTPSRRRRWKSAGLTRSRRLSAGEIPHGRPGTGYFACSIIDKLSADKTGDANCPRLCAPQLCPLVEIASDMNFPNKINAR